MYKKGKYILFDELVRYNNSLFSEVINYNIRDELVISIIEYKLHLLNRTPYLDNVLLFNIIGSIWCMQPFYDGNTRTILYLVNSCLSRYNIKLDYINIPIFYSPNEVWEEDKIRKFIKKNY